MNIYLHIGSPKTGSTSIQKYLIAHREELREKKGLWVSALFKNKDANHGALNVASASIERITPAKRNFLEQNTTRDLLSYRRQVYQEINSDLQKAEAANCSATILSNEGLYFLNSVDEYSCLLSLFSYRKLTIILVTRNVISFKESFMWQLSSHNIDLSDTPDHFNYVNDDSYLFDYKRKIEMLSIVFDQVEVINYDQSVNKYGGITPAFLKSMGLGMNGHTEFFINSSVRPQ